MYSVDYQFDIFCHSKQCKEAEMFTTMVSMVANNMLSYVSLKKSITSAHLNEIEHDLNIVQLTIFDMMKEGVFGKLYTLS